MMSYLKVMIIWNIICVSLMILSLSPVQEVASQDLWSCTGRCGEGYSREHDCHCDYSCQHYKECCPDFNKVCTGAVSCKGRCFEVYQRGRECDCDIDCKRYGKCCPDYDEHCKELHTEKPVPETPPPNKSTSKRSSTDEEKKPKEDIGTTTSPPPTTKQPEITATDAPTTPKDEETTPEATEAPTTPEAEETTPEATEAPTTPKAEETTPEATEAPTTPKAEETTPEATEAPTTPKAEETTPEATEAPITPRVKDTTSKAIETVTPKIAEATSVATEALTTSTKVKGTTTKVTERPTTSKAEETTPKATDAPTTPKVEETTPKATDAPTTPKAEETTPKATDAPTTPKAEVTTPKATEAPTTKAYFPTTPKAEGKTASATKVPTTPSEKEVMLKATGAPVSLADSPTIPEFELSTAAATTVKQGTTTTYSKLLSKTDKSDRTTNPISMETSTKKETTKTDSTPKPTDIVTTTKRDAAVETTRAVPAVAECIIPSKDTTTGEKEMTTLATGTSYTTEKETEDSPEESPSFDKKEETTVIRGRTTTEKKDTIEEMFLVSRGTSKPDIHFQEITDTHDEPSPSSPETMPVEEAEINKPLIQTADLPVVSGGAEMGKADEKDLCSGKPADGMVALPNGTLAVFRGHYYWLLNGRMPPTTSPRRISEGWGIPSPIDAVFSRCNCDGKTFFIKGPLYWRFTNGVMDNGYPKPLANGFAGLTGKIKAALPVASYNGRPESVYFIKRDGNMQQYVYRQEPAKKCQRKARITIRYPAFVPRLVIRRRFQRAVGMPTVIQTVRINPYQSGVLRKEVKVTAYWRGLPKVIHSTISVPNYNKPDGYDYYAFSYNRYYSLDVGKRIARPVTALTGKTVSKDWYNCPEK
ncbi:proteoglycan 4 isoform X2 [Coturnix japonica]|uniref:proteoglycan 4 isoform X2 n=1 Tax=Coturnix japonica TaxID=93934 RepID=UPI0007778EAA|nr:proteoglycan 4 isoform X2 [Coturnix japonica]